MSDAFKPKSWFQVMCPKCTAALQTRLPVGITAVECSQCKEVFSVQVEDAAMPSDMTSVLVKRSRIENVTPPSQVRAAYNSFLKSEMRRLYKEEPNLTRQDVMRKAAADWQDSPLNPHNGTDLAGAPAVPDERPVQSNGEGKRRADPKGTPNKGGARTRVRRGSDGGGTHANGAGPSSAAEPVVADGEESDGEYHECLDDEDIVSEDPERSLISRARQWVGW